MQQSPLTLPILASESHLSKNQVKRRREHLQHIHRMTHEQKIALIEEARAARSRGQAQSG
jgi:hypothetical protein